MGLVMAVGEGKNRPKGEKHPMVVKVGEKVMYKQMRADLKSKSIGKKWQWLAKTTFWQL